MFICLDYLTKQNSILNLCLLLIFREPGAMINSGFGLQRKVFPAAWRAYNQCSLMENGGCYYIILLISK